MQNDEQTRKILSRIFASELKDLSLHLDWMTLSKFIYMFSTGVEMITRSGNNSKMPSIGPSLGWMIDVFEGKNSPEGVKDPYEKIQFTGEFLDDLLKEAESNEIAWMAAKELAIWFLKEKDSVPKKLYPFLTGEKPKRKPGRHPLENLHRNVCIVMLLTAIEKQGFKPLTRNSDSIYNNFYSLCDVMATALNHIGGNLSYTGVKRIWHKRRELSKHIPEFRISIESDRNVKVCYIGYADTSRLKSDLQIEAQQCWMIKKFILSPPVSFVLCSKYGTHIDIGNGSSFIHSSKKQLLPKRIQGKMEQKVNLFSLEIFHLTR